jgi:hypothetical protein
MMSTGSMGSRFGRDMGNVESVAIEARINLNLKASTKAMPHWSHLLTTARHDHYLTNKIALWPQPFHKGYILQNGLEWS